jgi:hypothetical protein
MATSGRNGRLEPAYKQHAAVDDVRGVILDVEVTTGEANVGGEIGRQADAVAAATGAAIKTITSDQGYACGKVLEPVSKLTLVRFSRRQGDQHLLCIDETGYSVAGIPFDTEVLVDLGN